MHAKSTILLLALEMERVISNFGPYKHWKSHTRTKKQKKILVQFSVHAESVLTDQCVHLVQEAWHNDRLLPPPPPPPAFDLQEYPEELTAQAGDDITIECDLEGGQPAPERVWRRNGVLVSPGGR